MYRRAIFISFVILTFSAATGWAESPSAMKATAPDKMMPKSQAAKMRSCDKLAMEQNIPMEDRTRFVEKCVGGKAEPRR